MVVAAVHFQKACYYGGATVGKISLYLILKELICLVLYLKIVFGETPVRWIKRWGLAIGAVVMTAIVEYIVTRAVGPTIDQWFNEITSLDFEVVGANSGLFSLLLTALIIGIIASWLVHKAERKAKQLEEDIKWLSGKYQIYKPTVDEIKESPKISLSAHMNLQPTTPDEVRFGEIQERIKKF